MKRKLQRATKEHSWLGGVCGGIAYRFGTPVWFVRFMWIFIPLIYGFGILGYVGGTVLSFFAVLLYLSLWTFLPVWKKLPSDFEEITKP